MIATKGPYRLNLLASWDRNLDPALKVASFCATFGRDSGAPAMVEARICFWNEGHARRWLETHSAKFVGGRLFPIVCQSRQLSLYRLHIDLATREVLSVVNKTGAMKYRRFMRGLLADNYNIDWQTPDYIPRTYKTRLALEAAMVGECQMAS